MPEPTGRTFAELDTLFERGVSARKFATAKIDAFEESVDGSVMEHYKHDIASSHRERQSQGSRRSK